MELTNVRATIYDESYLNESWNWFQDKELRRLTMTPAFSRQAQLDWFESLPQRDNYFIFGIELDGKPIGAFGIKNVIKSSGEYWGYIGKKRYWGRNVGKWMVNQAIELAKNRGLRRLWLKVLDENIRAINLYRGCGFEFHRSKDGISYMEIEI